ncbi:D-amino-acid transaminase [Bacillus marasmi]|uniref:D-amino-acid transaminase n=1 Tax=Bacillus marasmi TaxID=1926279 RepID=UPI0011CCAC6E|nr:D-amino-acid transaminase [Bacillus marasmi]
MNIVMVNGQFVERNEAKVDIEDRGYQFGDGIYEVIRVYNGKMFAASEHLERLVECAGKIKLTLPFSNTDIQTMLQTLIEKNALTTGIVYLQSSRGVAVRNHAFPTTDTVASFIAYTKELPRPLHNITNGVKAALVEDERWLKCDIKSLNLLGNILAKQEAAELGCFEAILHRGETVTEGSSSNISIVKDGVVYTHQADKYILNGITRQQMLALCGVHSIAFEEKSFTVEELLNADEVFMTSTTAEVTPIIEIAGRKIGTGAPGSISIKLQQLLASEIARQCGRIYLEIDR